MRSTLLNILMASAFIPCVTYAFADDQVRVGIPFKFTVLNQSFSAGWYDIALSEQPRFIRLADEKHSGRGITTLASPAEPAMPGATLTFEVVGDHHVLRRIRVEKYITTMRSDPRNRHLIAADSTKSP